MMAFPGTINCARWGSAAGSATYQFNAFWGELVRERQNAKRARGSPRRRYTEGISQKVSCAVDRPSLRYADYLACAAPALLNTVGPDDCVASRLRSVRGGRFWQAKNERARRSRFPTLSFRRGR